MSNQRNHTVLQFDDLVNTRQLGKLYQRAINIGTLNQKLHEYLDTPLKNHCQIADYSNEVLIISADASVWASRLHYCTEEILDYARKECGLARLKSVRIKVTPCSSP